MRARFSFRQLVKCFLVLAVMTPFLVSARAGADVGPKPSVRIAFTGAGDEIYYGTLLSKQESTGPAFAWDGIEEHACYPEGGYSIWKAFADYQDPDGFYFLQEFWDCSQEHRLDWTYYPPDTFKILLYFPESDSFCVSPIYETYAFDSRFTVDLSENGDRISAEKSYDYTWEVISLIFRIIITILLELAVALLFQYREKKVFAFLAAVNAATQVLLNLILNIVNYHAGAFAFAFHYILLELIVFVIEAALYAMLLPRLSAKPRGMGNAVCYAFAANFISFAAGFGISYLIPGIF